MGQFTSLCNRCNQPIHWFITCEDHVCNKCGALNRKQQIEESWQRYYRTYHEVMKDARSMTLKDLKEKWAGDRYGVYVANAIYLEPFCLPSDSIPDTDPDSV